MYLRYKNFNLRLNKFNVFLFWKYFIYHISFLTFNNKRFLFVSFDSCVFWYRTEEINKTHNNGISYIGIQRRTESTRYFQSTTANILNETIIEKNKYTDKGNESIDQGLQLLPFFGVCLSISSIFVVIQLYKWRNKYKNNRQDAEEENELVKYQSSTKV